MTEKQEHFSDGGWLGPLFGERTGHSETDEHGNKTDFDNRGEIVGRSSRSGSIETHYTGAAGGFSSLFDTDRAGHTVHGSSKSVSYDNSGKSTGSSVQSGSKIDRFDSKGNRVGYSILSSNPANEREFSSSYDHKPSDSISNKSSVPTSGAGSGGGGGGCSSDDNSDGWVDYDEAYDKGSEDGKKAGLADKDDRQRRGWKQFYDDSGFCDTDGYEEGFQETYNETLGRSKGVIMVRTEPKVQEIEQQPRIIVGSKLPDQSKIKNEQFNQGFDDGLVDKPVRLYTKAYLRGYCQGITNLCGQKHSLFMEGWQDGKSKRIRRIDNRIYNEGYDIGSQKYGRAYADGRRGVRIKDKSLSYITAYIRGFRDNYRFAVEPYVYFNLGLGYRYYQEETLPRLVVYQSVSSMMNGLHLIPSGNLSEELVKRALRMTKQQFLENEDRFILSTIQSRKLVLKKGWFRKVENDLVTRALRAVMDQERQKLEQVKLDRSNTSEKKRRRRE